MANVLTDTFTEASDTNLESHTPDVNTAGHAWVKTSGGIKARAGDYASNAGSAGLSLYTIDVGESDIDLRLSLINRAVGSAGNTGAIFRWSDSSNYWYAYIWNDGKLYLSKYESGVNTDISSYVISGYSVSTDYDLNVVTSGSDIEIFLDSVSRITTTNSFNATATNIGLFIDDGGDDNAVDTLTVDSAASAPSVPTSLAHGTVTSTTVPLTWDTMAGATGYYVQVSNDSGFPATDIDLGVWTVTYDTATAAAGITGLQPGTTHYFKVAAYNDAGTSAYCVAISATTSTLPLVAPALTLVSKTSTTITVSWTDATGGMPPYAYAVFFQNVDNVLDTFEYDDAVSPLTTDPSLTPGATYTVVVWASDDDFATHVVSNEITVRTRSENGVVAILGDAFGYSFGF